jgi:phospholipid transport system substrate-binding protein
MNMTNAIRFLLLSCVLVSGSIGAQEAMPPDVLVKNVTTEVVEIIAKDKEIRSGNRAKLIEVIDAKVLPHFNFSSMTSSPWGRTGRALRRSRGSS